jgi:hypothetical protein
MTAPGGTLSFVMAGLVPAIHVFLAACFEDVDARDKPGQDEYRALRRRRLCFDLHHNPSGRHLFAFRDVDGGNRA